MKHALLLKRWLLVLSLAIILVACASAPVQEMSDARLALDAARKANADRLIPSVYAQAVGYLQDASRMLYFGQYQYSREQALKAIAQAQALRELALRLQRAKHVIENIENHDADWYEAHSLMLTAYKAAAEGWLNEANQLAGYALRRVSIDAPVEAAPKQ